MKLFAQNQKLVAYLILMTLMLHLSGQAAYLHQHIELRIDHHAMHGGEPHQHVHVIFDTQDSIHKVPSVEFENDQVFWSQFTSSLVLIGICLLLIILQGLRSSDSFHRHLPEFCLRCFFPSLPPPRGPPLGNVSFSN